MIDNLTGKYCYEAWKDNDHKETERKIFWVDKNLLLENMEGSWSLKNLEYGYLRLWK